MKKYLIIIYIAISITGLFFYWNYNKFVQFYPVQFNSNEYLIDKQIPSNEFYNNLKKVLDYYGEEYKEQGNIIYIRNKIFMDKEMIYNYTKKSNDTVWLFSKYPR